MSEYHVRRDRLIAGELAVIAAAAAFAKGTDAAGVPKHPDAAATSVAHNLGLTGATIRETKGGFALRGSALTPLRAGFGQRVAPVPVACHLRGQ